MTQDSPSRRQEQFVVRLPDGMRDRIAEAAQEAGRSMNAEIVQRLEWSFTAPTMSKGDGSVRPMTVGDFEEIVWHQQKIAEGLAKRFEKAVSDLRADVLGGRVAAEDIPDLKG